jgi:hypothetical protein
MGGYFIIYQGVLLDKLQVIRLVQQSAQLSSAQLIEALSMYLGV